MAKQQTKLTEEKMKEIEKKLSAKIDEEIKKVKEGRRSPAQEFLNRISHIIKKGLENGVSYRQLAKDIYSIANYKISQQTIRAFAHNVLGIEKKSRNRKVKNNNTTNNTAEDKTKNTTADNGRKTSSFDDI